VNWDDFALFTGVLGRILFYYCMWLKDKAVKLVRAMTKHLVTLPVTLPNHRQNCVCNINHNCSPDSRMKNRILRVARRDNKTKTVAWYTSWYHKKTQLLGKGAFGKEFIGPLSKSIHLVRISLISCLRHVPCPTHATKREVSELAVVLSRWI
jgi:hypothetical protein